MTVLSGMVSLTKLAPSATVTLTITNEVVSVPTLMVVPEPLMNFQSSRAVPAVAGAVMALLKVNVALGATVPLTAMSRWSLMLAPLTNRNLYPEFQVVVPVLRSVQVLVKLWLGAMTVLSGMVSLTKLAPSEPRTAWIVIKLKSSVK